MEKRKFMKSKPGSFILTSVFVLPLSVISKPVKLENKRTKCWLFSFFSLLKCQKIVYDILPKSKVTFSNCSFCLTPKENPKRFNLKGLKTMMNRWNTSSIKKTGLKLVETDIRPKPDAEV